MSGLSNQAFEKAVYDAGDCSNQTQSANHYGHCEKPAAKPTTNMAISLSSVVYVLENKPTG